MTEYEPSPANVRLARQTIVFTFKGVEYSLDLSSGNAGKARELMQAWFDAACSREITEKPAQLIAEERVARE
jgi:hypothetical protein